MEGLIVLAVIWFVVSQISKANKKGNQQARRPEVMRRAVPETARPEPEGRPEVAKVATVRREGVGEEDEAGCVGGSLPHTAHEGDGPSGSLNYQPEVSYEHNWRAPEKEAAAVQERARIAPRQMRSAVVMAEVLNRPVSMRERRIGGGVRR